MAAAAAGPTGSTIESLFRPSTRFRNAHQNRRGEGWAELELLQDLTLEDVLATGTRWEDFCLFRQNKVVWMTPDVYVGCAGTASDTDDPEVFTLTTIAERSRPLSVHVSLGMAAAAATATCDFLLRLLATCEHHDVCISGTDDNRVSPPLSGAGLSLFFQESRSCLREVTLQRMVLSEDQCLALATMSRLDVELHMFDCSLADDAAEAFVECLRSDRGPVGLYECRIDSQILANALTGKSRVTRLKLGRVGTERAALFTALASNRNLVDLNLRFCPISDENWMILCQSLQVHPTLTSLNLVFTSPGAQNDVQRTQRMRVLAEMVQRNTSLHAIELSTRHYNHQMYTKMIHPYLKTNQYRPRVLAITKAAIPLRRPLLGRALQTESMRNNSNLRWMFLSGNPDVVLSNEDAG
jgi:hypothetical protein